MSKTHKSTDTHNLRLEEQLTLACDRAEENERARAWQERRALAAEARIEELETERNTLERLLAEHATHLVRRRDGTRLFRGLHSEDEIATTGGSWVLGRTTLAEQRASDLQHQVDLLRSALPNAAECESIRSASRVYNNGDIIRKWLDNLDDVLASLRRRYRNVY